AARDAVCALSVAVIRRGDGRCPVPDVVGRPAAPHLGRFRLLRRVRRRWRWRRRGWRRAPPVTSRPYPAFLALPCARTGFSTFFGASLTAFLPLPLPEIGSSISRWPSTRFFLPLAFAAGGALAAGALRSPTPARLFLSASIRLMTLPL